MRFPTSDALSPSREIRLEGMATAGPECLVELAEAHAWGLHFGPVLMDDAATQSLILRDVGSAPCTVSALQTSPSPFTAITVPPLTIEPGGEAPLAFRFAPPFTLQYQALAQILTSGRPYDEVFACSAPFGPFTGQPGCLELSLDGSGSLPQLSVQPQEIRFGEVTLGCPVFGKAVRVYNRGVTSVPFLSVAAAPAAGPFRVLAAPPAQGQRLAPGDVMDIVVGYSPLAAQAEAGTLKLEFLHWYPTVPLSGAGRTDAAQVDLFTAITKPKVDVLFVIDDSGSMEEEQAALATNAERFMEAAALSSVDYQIGVVTTSAQNEHNSCHWEAWPGAPCGWPETIIQPGVLYGDPKIITSSIPHPVDALTRNMQPGTLGDSEEQGLLAAAMALSAPLVTNPARNGGLLRQDARLAVIVVSDEDDSSPGTVESFVELLSLAKGGQAGNVSVSAVVGDLPSGCVSGDAWAGAGARYIAIADQTGGLFRSICSPNWGWLAEDLGLTVFASQPELVLSRQADPSTLVVTFDGAPAPQSDWTYNGSRNSIVFAPGVAPPAGSRIEVRYSAQCPG